MMFSDQYHKMYGDVRGMPVKTNKEPVFEAVILIPGLPLHVDVVGE